MNKQNINPAKYIDHTILKPDALEADIINLCEEAIQYNFHSVCINPWWVRLAHSILKDKDVSVCTVAGFPLGMSKVKAVEAETAVKDGADEIDMVLAVGELKGGNDRAVLNDIKEVVSCGKPVKVILETCLLTDDEIVQACLLSKEAGAAFVKTSTGFSTGGAEARIVRLMKDTVKDELSVKASGGIKTLSDFYKMIEAGAGRVGTSSSVSIFKEYSGE